MDNTTPKTSFGQWLSPINMKLFHSQVAAYQVESTHALSDCLLDERLQSSIDLDSISHSQLSRRLGTIDTDIFQNLFLDLVTQIQSRETKRSAMPLKIIDSSTLPLNLNQHRWAEFRQTKAGVKLHLRLVFMEKGISYPEKAVITPAKQHDRNLLEVMVDDSECMYVFDRGYLDYERFDRMTDDGSFFLSRLRQNAVVHVIEDFKVPKAANVETDQMIWLGGSQNRAENVFRRLEIVDSQGNHLNLITNRFDLDPDEISEMYRSRWAIELFFKWVKQHLRIKQFYGQSEQAIHNQIFIALIVFCLHVLAQQAYNDKRKILQISRYLKATLWQAPHTWIRRIKGRASP